MSRILKDTFVVAKYESFEKETLLKVLMNKSIQVVPSKQVFVTKSELIFETKRE